MEAIWVPERKYEKTTYVLSYSIKNFDIIKGYIWIFL